MRANIEKNAGLFNTPGMSHSSCLCVDEVKEAIIDEARKVEEIAFLNNLSCAFVRDGVKAVINGKEISLREAMEAMEAIRKTLEEVMVDYKGNPLMVVKEWGISI